MEKKAQKNCRVVVLTDPGEEVDWLWSRLQDAGFSPFFVANEEDLLDSASMPGVGLFILMGEALEHALPAILFGIGASRAETAPVILLVASCAVLETHSMSTLGVDDFLMSPWSTEEIIARVSTLCGTRSLRRERRPHDFHGFQLARSRWSVRYASKEAMLTPSEFEITRVLIRHLGAPVSRQMLPQGPRQDEEQSTESRSLDTLVSRVRRKLEPIVAGEFRVRSLYGVGYTLERTYGRDD